MSHFVNNLSSLLRTGDTRALELVIGLIAVVFGAQVVATLTGSLPPSALLDSLPDVIVGVLASLFILGGILKTLGAVLGTSVIRIVAALLLSGVWLYLSFTSWQFHAVFSIILFLIFSLQSAWIYIRLSLLRKQEAVLDHRVKP